VTAPFLVRHIGPSAADQERMLAELGLQSLEQLAAEIVPADILLPAAAAAEGLPEACGEAEALAELAAIADDNQLRRSLIGLGYYGTAASPDPAPCSGKPLLVHRLYPLPGGDRPGAAGGPAQFPDPGQRADRSADRQRFPAG